MTTSQTIDTVRAAFLGVAPELEAEFPDLDPDVDVWTELQLDSMDHLAVMERLAAAIGRDVPESDYPKLLSLGAIHRYVEEAS